MVMVVMVVLALLCPAWLNTNEMMKMEELVWRHKSKLSVCQSVCLDAVCCLYARPSALYQFVCLSVHLSVCSLSCSFSCLFSHHHHHHH